MKPDVFIVGGFGHIGLPLGIFLADAGLTVLLHDIDHGKAAAIREGRMPFLEHGAESILARVIGERLFIADGLGQAASADTIIITIGTPLDEYLNPKLLPMLRLAEDLAPHLRPGHHVMLRSTVFPGTSRQVAAFFERRVPGVHLTTCPERIVQGQAILELPRIPQIVSGSSDEAAAAAEAFFARVAVKTVRLSLEEAELAKLFSNAWRYLQFAIANQMYMMASDAGADFFRIYHAMTWEYDRAKGLPLPGFAAGPCLFKDTVQLAAAYKNTFQLGHQAMLINEGLPQFLVEELRARHGVDLGRSRIGILGMAFKADIDDIRDSLSYKLGKILRFHGADVRYSDELAKDPTFISKEELVESCPIIIVGVPHSAYRDLVIPEARLVIDLWRVVKR
jgi:UDP-N-acetyl-D-mannosaminuronic acid dehydrogenase